MYEENFVSFFISEGVCHEISHILHNLYAFILLATFLFISNKIKFIQFYTIYTYCRIYRVFIILSSCSLLAVVIVYPEKFANALE
jgi:hypothetical protein